MPLPLGFFLDSGAFSALTLKTSVDIDAYIAFIKKYEKYVEVYANLDAIGDAEQTLKNQKYMESKGLKPLPTFHTGEDWKYLDYYVKNYDYIALGGTVGSGFDNKQKQLWFDECFSKYICDKDGMPKVKTHAFGMTSFRLLFRYPWYSADSTSWNVTARNGEILIMPTRKGKLDYSKPPFKLGVSALSPSLKEKGAHYRNISPAFKKQVDKYLKDMGFIMGKTEFKNVDGDYELKENERFLTKKGILPRKVEVTIEPGLENCYKQRNILAIKYFDEFEKHFKPYPWAFKLEKDNEGLF